MKTKILGMLALGLLAGPMAAQALTCGGPSGTRTLTINPAAACTATGLTNLGDGAAAAVVGGTMLDRDTANSNGGLLNITGVGASSGTWTLDASLWSTNSTLYLYVHFGNGNPADPTFNPDWFIVQLTSGATAGTWSVNPTQLGLSNIGVIGISTSSTTTTTTTTTTGTPSTSGGVPAPASTLSLLGLGLIGLGYMRRAQRASA